MPLLPHCLADGGVAYVEARQWPEALPEGLELVRRDKAGMVQYGLLGCAAA